MINAPAAWRDTRGEGVVVAVLDTGCDVDHPDLRENIIGGRNFTPDYGGDPGNFRDNHYHGTHVAGTIAAADNSVGLLGVAPKAKLLICKVLSGQGSGANDWIAAAIRWCVGWRGPAGERVSIINMSLGGPDYDQNLHLAVKDAVAANILVVCAAGNEGDGNPGTEEISYPAYFPESTAVGAVDLKAKTANFSNANREIDVAGPGVDVYSTYPGGQWARLSGTSMATPHAAGFAALLASKHLKRTGRLPTEPELYAMLKTFTVDVEDAGVDSNTGAGLVSFLPWIGKQVKYRIGQPVRYVNGELVEMDVAPVIIDGRTMAPVRCIAEDGGAVVTWDGEKQEVTIDYGG